MKTNAISVERDILHVVSYFDNYDYPPSIEELRLFLPSRVEKTDFFGMLERLVVSKMLLKKNDRYCYRKAVFSHFEVNESRSKVILKGVKRYLLLLRFCPSIRFVGISGSLSMLDNDKDDDVDLFIITSHDRIWFTRFVILLYKHILKMILPQSLAELYCFNIFFDERDLTIKKHRRSEYVAHEVLQLKPLINKNQIHEQFLIANKWIEDFFPNVQLNASVDKDIRKKSGTFFIMNYIEKITEKMQKIWLDRKGISHCQENGQLWLIQEGV